ncbi:MAG: sulfatase-like hydrolase/transferase [Spirochaetia bacterium]|nr:sulfatase-like hydrolase/transferase [Spirochaetia bacterium]
MRSRFKNKIKIDRHILIALSFCIPVILSRIFILIFSADFHFTSSIYIFYIIRGIISDLIPTFITGYIISFIPLRLPWRFVIYFLWVFTCIFSAANAEHIIVNLGNIDFRYTQLGLSHTMLKGSVMTSRVLLLMSFILVLSFLIIKLAKISIKKLYQNSMQYVSTFRQFTRTIPLFVILTCSLLVLPTNYSIFTCIQMGLVEENILKTYYNLYSSIQYEKIPLNDNITNSIFGQDLNAPLVVDRPQQKYNVLLVLVESIGYETVKSGMMPNLTQLSKNTLYYPRYLISQKQTNRGMYNVLCGDYPNLVSYKAKASQLTAHKENTSGMPRCLPEVLKSADYQTVYLQSAPMQFMHKERFISQMGFDEFHGENYFKNIYGRAGWGVDDRTLYFAALDKIKEMASKHKPWFMTLLTVSTHHPYRPTDKAKSNYAASVKYADDALGEFYAHLEKMNLLENTIVIFTTDESHGPLNGGTIALISRNHGFMAIHLPVEKKYSTRRPAFILNDLFAAHDLEISIADYLGLPVKNLKGRSLFRKYNRENRHLIFGHTYAGIFYYLDDQHLYVCNYDYMCSYYTLKGKFFEDYKYQFSGYEKDTSSLKAIIQFNDWID